MSQEGVGVWPTLAARFWHKRMQFFCHMWSSGGQGPVVVRLTKRRCLQWTRMAMAEAGLTPFMVAKDEAADGG